MAWPVTIEAEKVLIREGEDSQSMYLVQAGKLKVTRKDGDQEVILGYIGPGEMVGEMSFLDQQPRSATVRAVEDSKLIQIPVKTIEELYKSQPPWFEAFIKNIVNRIRQSDAKIRI